MSAHDLFRRLIRALDDETRAVQELAARLGRARLSFVALRPGELDAAVRALAPDAERAQAAAARRGEAWQAAAAAVALEPGAKLRDLVARAAPELRAQLERSGRAAVAAAGALRVETGVGARLLDFSRRSHEAMFLDLVEADTTRGYDRQARGTTHAAGTGRLISGTI
jgi:hypothetical protein